MTLSISDERMLYRLGLQAPEAAARLRAELEAEYAPTPPRERPVPRGTERAPRAPRSELTLRAPWSGFSHDAPPAPRTERPELEPVEPVFARRRRVIEAHLSP